VAYEDGVNCADHGAVEETKLLFHLTLDEVSPLSLRFNSSALKKSMKFSLFIFLKVRWFFLVFSFLTLLNLAFLNLHFSLNLHYLFFVFYILRL